MTPEQSLQGSFFSESALFLIMEAEIAEENYVNICSKGIGSGVVCERLCRFQIVFNAAGGMSYLFERTELSPAIWILLFRWKKMKVYSRYLKPWQ